MSCVNQLLEINSIRLFKNTKAYYNTIPIKLIGNKANNNIQNDDNLRIPKAI